MKTSDPLLNRYHDKQKKPAHWREIEKDCIEITSPYLDQHNDYIQVYLKLRNGQSILTDDGYTLDDLASSGYAVCTPHSKAVIATILNDFGVQQHSDALEIRVTEKNSAQSTVNLLQAILKIKQQFDPEFRVQVIPAKLKL